MLAKKISSLQHPIVKKFVKLRTCRKARYAQKQIPLLGMKLVKEAQKVDILLTAPGFSGHIPAKERYLVSCEILRKISGQAAPEPVAAIHQMPPLCDLREKRRALALDRVSDPGNVGVLIRSACALGFEGVFLTQGSADPFSDKALRSAMGAALHIPLQLGSCDELIELSSHFTPLVADMSGTPIGSLGLIDRPLLILGSEAQGASKELKAAFAAVSIPIQRVESLNVGAAGAILMYHLAYEG